MVAVIFSCVSLVVAMPRRAKLDEDAGAPTAARHASLEWFTPQSDSATVFRSTPAVDIAEGTWKYLQMEIQYEDERRLIVRSVKDLQFHSQIYDLTVAQLGYYDIQCRVVGGGRIRRDSRHKDIAVSGHAKFYGRSPGCNEQTASILRDFMREEYTIRWSDEGS